MYAEKENQKGITRGGERLEGDREKIRGPPVKKRRGGRKR